MNDFRDQRVTVMGLGRFGGGAAAVRYLAERGARVTVTDLRRDDELRASIDQIADLPGLEVVLGEHREQDFRDIDLVVANPAVPPPNRFLRIAEHAGVPITTEVNLFWQANRGRVIGITGTVGKSTTATITAAIIGASGATCRLGGNIGRSLLDETDNIGTDDWVVLELSSFQLHHLDRIRASPEIAVVTSFSPNHLDWHESVDNYRRAKQTLLRWQGPGDRAILISDDTDVDDWPCRSERFQFGTTDHGENGVYVSDGMLVFRDRHGEDVHRAPALRDFPGTHNQANIAAAACAAWQAGMDAADVVSGLRSAKPLPHRIEFVGEVGGRRFYNDSKATTPDAVIAALRTFDSPVVLLAGGYDKKIDLNELCRHVSDRAHHAVLMGQTAERMAQLLANGQCRFERAMSFAEACRLAYAASRPGDIVLLSPGCASFGWFADYEERGDRFREFVSELSAEIVS